MTLDRHNSAALGADEGGAVALMSLAAMLIIIMIVLILFDLAELGVEKTHLQTATDASAYSQATVQARGMNMLAFANTGKRMTVGMSTTYISLYQWLHNLEHLVWHSNHDEGGEDPENPYLAPTIGDPPTPICDEPVSDDDPNLFAYCDQLASLNVSTILDLRVEEGLAPGDDRDPRYSNIGGEVRIYDPDVDDPDPDDPAFVASDATPRGSIFQKGGVKTMHITAANNEVPYHPVLEWAAPIGDAQEFTHDIHGGSPARCDYLDTGGSGALNSRVECVDDIRDPNVPGELIDYFYGRDLVAYDNYQRYLLDMVPWWAWMEGVMRGLANAAPVTLSYPMPEVAGSQEVTFELPVNRGTWQDTCEQVDAVRGVDGLLGTDIARQNSIEGVLDSELENIVGSGTQLARALIAYGSMKFNDLDDGSNPSHQVLPRDWQTICVDITGMLFENAQSGTIGGTGLEYVDDFREFGQPYLINEYDDNDQALWLMATSNLMFGFRPNINRFEDGREKFFAPARSEEEADVGGLDAAYDHMGEGAGGIWAMARSEIAFQSSGTPDGWASRWSARLRPVALPDEWSAFERGDWEGTGPDENANLEEMFPELQDAVEHITDEARKLDENSENNLLTHNHGPLADSAEYLDEEWDAIEAVVRALGAGPGSDHSRMEGLAR